MPGELDSPFALADVAMLEGELAGPQLLQARHQRAGIDLGEKFELAPGRQFIGFLEHECRALPHGQGT